MIQLGALAPRNMVAVVKSIGEKKDRSKNVIVVGVSEEDSESVYSKVAGMLKRLEEKPKVSALKEEAGHKPAHKFQSGELLRCYFNTTES